MIDQFITLPIKFINKETKEVRYEYRRFRPERIEAYGPAVDEDEPESPVTVINMFSGDNFYIYLSVEDFEKRIVKYQNAQKKS